MNTTDVGKFIAVQRKRKSLTQKELALKLNVTDKAVSKWETGKCYPDIEIIEKLSEIFEVSINEILSGKITEPENQIIEAEKNIVAIIKISKKVKFNLSILILILSVVIICISVFSVVFFARNGIKEHQFLTATEAVISDKRSLYVDLPEVGLEDVFIHQVDHSIMLNEDFYGNVYLLADSRWNSYTMPYDNYIVIISKEKIIAKDLSAWDDQFAYGGTLDYVDVDGDTDMEIILQETVGMTGGYGQYLSRVFDFKDGEIKEIFSSEKDFERYDTGFTAMALSGNKFRMENKFTGYKEVFSLKNRDENYYKINWYDKDGKLKALEPMFDSFYKFEPFDIDDDGVYEIKCHQYTSLYGHSDFIGTAVSFLKYNVEKECFEVYDAHFKVSDS